MRWGLVPSWAKDPADLPLMFNARAETLLEKPAFRGSARHHRCVVPASGYYEWQKTDNGKIPNFIRAVGEETMLLAGLYDTWLGPTGEEFDSVTIVTVAAGEGMAHLHDRMPAVLTEEAVPAWLDVQGTDAKTAHAMLHPARRGEMAFYPVSTRVNSNRNNDPELIEPVTSAKPAPAEPKKSGSDGGQGELF
jgi:putative SOS response-associated peptidase YedK